VLGAIGFLCVSLGSSTVTLRECLGSRRTCTCTEAGFSSKNGDRVGGYTTDEQSSVVRSLWAKEFSVKETHKETFVVGSVCRLKLFRTGPRNSLSEVRKSHMMPDQVRKWLRQQSKDFYAVGFEGLVEQWDECIDVGGG
jgi:hypothetical protein